MDYTRKKVAITGSTGFIGSSLAKELKSAGAMVLELHGDVRSRKTFEQLDHTFDYLFHFGAPSSQVLFNRQPLLSGEVTIMGFLNALGECRRYGIKLIYPSTGLLSSDRENEYARCKKVCEDMAVGSDALGIRIFGTYGPGESHKRDYASVPYLFAREIANGRSPVIFGDGKQSRDFIYIDDTVAGIMTLAEKCNEPTIDLGSGMPVTFEWLVETINHKYSHERKEPVFIDKPQGYVNETEADLTKTRPLFMGTVGIEEGLKRTFASIKREHNWLLDDE